MSENSVQEHEIQLVDICKNYGNFQALKNISFTVPEGQVTCLLGDNGAGKSSLIKIISGVSQPTSGQLIVNGVQKLFNSPQQALDVGISTVFQDLAVIPDLSVWRNFFLGQELCRFGILDAKRMQKITQNELEKMGVQIPDIDVPISSLSGGQRQVVAIARAIYFGAKYLILDEPTAALGVKQSGIVLQFIQKVRDSGVGVIFITHNPHHALLVGDQFILLQRGEVVMQGSKDTITLEELTEKMSGGLTAEQLSHELAAR